MSHLWSRDWAEPSERIPPRPRSRWGFWAVVVAFIVLFVVTGRQEAGPLIEFAVTKVERK